MRHPDSALAINPNSPRALIAKAESLRSAFFLPAAAVRAQPEAAESQSISRLPRAQDVQDEAGAPSGREILRSQISRLARKAIANDPLNATAFRLLAEAADTTDQTRALMQEAVKRSRREVIALLWLLNDSYSRKDWIAAIAGADILLRAAPDLEQYSMRYLVAIAHYAEGRILLAGKLAESPSWRAQFLGAFSELFREDQAALALLAELKKSKRPATTREIGVFINHLTWVNAGDAAYNLWMQTLPPERLGKLGILTNPNFENDPDDTVMFNWFIRRGQNAIAEFLPSTESEGQRLLHVSFGEGRVQFPEAAQVLILPPGRYRLEGRLRGSITSRRGLRWQLRCLDPFETVFGESEMLLGRSEQWRVFTMEARVPENKDCRAQLLRLFHDSRSASEQFITGEVWFGSLRLDAIGSQSR